MKRVALLVLTLLITTGCGSDKVVINTKAATTAEGPVGVGGPGSGGSNTSIVGGKDKKIPHK